MVVPNFKRLFWLYLLPIFSFYARRCEEDHNSNRSGHRCEWSDTDASHRACRHHAHLGLASLSACEEARKRESSELDRGNEAEETGKLGSLSSNECAFVTTVIFDFSLNKSYCKTQLFPNIYVYMSEAFCFR